MPQRGVARRNCPAGLSSETVRQLGRRGAPSRLPDTRRGGGQPSQDSSEGVADVLQHLLRALLGLARDRRDLVHLGLHLVHLGLDGAGDSVLRTLDGAGDAVLRSLVGPVDAVDRPLAHPTRRPRRRVAQHPRRGLDVLHHAQRVLCGLLRATLDAGPRPVGGSAWRRLDGGGHLGGGLRGLVLHGLAQPGGRLHHGGASTVQRALDGVLEGFSDPDRQPLELRDDRVHGPAGCQHDGLDDLVDARLHCSRHAAHQRIGAVLRGLLQGGGAVLRSLLRGRGRIAWGSGQLRLRVLRRLLCQALRCCDGLVDGLLGIPLRVRNRLVGLGLHGGGQGGGDALDEGDGAVGRLRGKGLDLRNSDVHGALHRLRYRGLDALQRRGGLLLHSGLQVLGDVLGDLLRGRAGRGRDRRRLLGRAGLGGLRWRSRLLLHLLGLGLRRRSRLLLHLIGLGGRLVHRGRPEGSLRSDAAGERRRRGTHECGGVEVAHRRCEAGHQQPEGRQGCAAQGVR
mmetsp:Transcript_11462/g.29514  ORF Transcript_11462/g.29514 Transcript_11462/m.29514 type:complete len:509 (+) Transcript_11462:251-1777(+)